MKFFRRDLVIEVPDTVYCPHDDSLLLLEVLEKHNNIAGKKALDLGCGSGLIAVAMAKKGAVVTAVDINEDAVAVAKLNAENNKVNITAAESDLFYSVSDKFDIIACNPPYLPEKEETKNIVSEKHLKQWYGGSSGREVIEKIAKDAKNHLAKNGKLFLLISSLTGEHEVLSLLEKEGFQPKIAARKKVPWEELMVIES